MNREILFRGKRVDNGEWIRGDLITSAGHPDRAWIPECKTLFDRQMQDIGIREVDKSTVGQYTGLTDKNGVKIFEGDILKTTNSNCLIWFVDFKLTSFCANQGNANYSCELGDFMSVSEVEVIGNIHDNPELLRMEART